MVGVVCPDVNINVYINTHALVMKRRGLKGDRRGVKKGKNIKTLDEWREGRGPTLKERLPECFRTASWTSKTTLMRFDRGKNVPKEPFATKRKRATEFHSEFQQQIF